MDKLRPTGLIPADAFLPGPRRLPELVQQSPRERQDADFNKHTLTYTYFVRPPDILVGGLMFYHGLFLLVSFFLSFYSSTTLRAR